MLLVRLALLQISSLSILNALSIQRMENGDVINGFEERDSCSNVTDAVTTGAHTCKCSEGQETFILTKQNQFKCLSRTEIDKDCSLLAYQMSGSQIPMVENNGLLDFQKQDALSTCNKEVSLSIFILGSNSKLSNVTGKQIIYNDKGSKNYIKIDNYPIVFLAGHLLKITFMCGIEERCVLVKAGGNIEITRSTTTTPASIAPNVSDESSNNSMLIGIISAVGLLVIIIILVLVIWYHKRSKTNKNMEQSTSEAEGYNADEIQYDYVTNSDMMQPAVIESNRKNSQEKVKIINKANEKSETLGSVNKGNVKTLQQIPKEYPILTAGHNALINEQLMQTYRKTNNKNLSLPQDNPINRESMNRDRKLNVISKQKKIDDDNYLSFRPNLSSSASVSIDTPDDLYESSNKNREIIVSTKSEDSIFVDTGIEYDDPVNMENTCNHTDDDSVYFETAPDVYAQVVKPKKNNNDSYLNKYA